MLLDLSTKPKAVAPCPADLTSRAKRIPSFIKYLERWYHLQVLKQSASLRIAVSLEVDQAGDLVEWWVSAEGTQRMRRLPVILDWNRFLHFLTARTRTDVRMRGACLIPAAAPEEPEIRLVARGANQLSEEAGGLAEQFRSLGPGTVVPVFRSGDDIYLNSGWTFDLSKDRDSRVFESGLWIVPEAVFGEDDLLKVLLT